MTAPGNIAELMKRLPKEYLSAFEDLKIIKRKRYIKDPSNIIPLLLYHLLYGCSLIETSAFAKLNGVSLSDVGFMRMFSRCAPWIEWVNSHIALNEQAAYAAPSFLSGRRVVAVDGSDVISGGKKKKTFRLHYGIDIFNMTSAFFKITEREVGETLKNFDAIQGDVIIGDRAYASITGIQHCVSHGADYLLRFRNKAFALYNGDGKISLLDELNKLTDAEILDLRLELGVADGSKMPIRVCAVRKTPEAMALSARKLRRKESRKQTAISPETKDFNNFIVLVTSLSNEASAKDILKLYRYRWQVEMYFKRLKSLFGFGEIPKKRVDSAKAWLNGKLMIALLMESIIGSVVFSPN